MWQNPKQLSYTPRLPSANAFDYYYSLEAQVRGMPYESSGLPLTPREVQWLKRNQSVFRTLAQAQSKPFTLPEPFVEAQDFLYLATFRQLARAVSLQVRWHISENDGADAVRDWQAGFKMVRDLYGDTMLNLLVGIACEAILVHAIAPHVPQFLSAREARELAQTLINAETQPDRLNTLVETELRMALHTIRQLLVDDPAEARVNLLSEYNALMDISEASAEIDPDARDVWQRERQQLERGMEHYIQNPAAYQQLRRELEQQLRRLATRRFEAFALKGGKFHRYEEQSPATGDFVMDTLIQSTDPLLTASQAAQFYWEARARRRLLALHCLLREYYLRERRYPDSLEQLRPDKWATDPFSGKLPIYRREGEGYTLYSVGVAGKDVGGYRRQLNDPPGTPANLFVTINGAL